MSTSNMSTSNMSTSTMSTSTMFTSTMSTSTMSTSTMSTSTVSMSNMSMSTMSMSTMSMSTMSMSTMSMSTMSTSNMSTSTKSIIGVMLYLDLAGVYLPFSLHSQTSLLYRAHDASQPSLYGPTTLSGTTTRWRSKRQLIYKCTPAYDTLLRSSQTGGFVDGLFQLRSPLL